MTKALAIAFVTAASILAAAANGTAATTGCKAGLVTVENSPARVFCGPARASVRVGGKTLSFREGLCEQSGGGFVVNLGTFFPGSSASKRPYFGLLVERPRAGTYRRQALSFRSGGVSRGGLVTVSLKSLRGGTFSGDLVGGGRVTGSFSC